MLLEKRILVILALGALLAVSAPAPAKQVIIEGKGSQQRGTPTSGAKLSASPFTLPSTGTLINFSGTAESFWITNAGGKTVFTSAPGKNPVGFTLAAGAYYVYPNLGAGMNYADVIVQFQCETGGPVPSPSPTSPLGKTTVLFDDFERGTLDSSLWELRSATGKGSSFGSGSGVSVHIHRSGQDGSVLSQLDGQRESILVITQEAADRGGAVVTKPITPVPGKLLKITKRTMVHYGGNHFTGITAILSEDLSRVFGQVTYAHYEAMNCFYAGFLKSPATLPSIWNTWFSEYLIFDPTTGDITLQVNGASATLKGGGKQGGVPVKGPFRVGMHAYGWGTGHSHSIDSIRIEWINKI
ncbi:MAG: hypothetical protein RDV48_21655 [Candidatus Eremiobacteraeota bacterium]|nr:hypothetical protein [Candidatus Eremiobacteraeota bacterium]